MDGIGGKAAAGCNILVLVEPVKLPAQWLRGWLENLSREWQIELLTQQIWCRGRFYAGVNGSPSFADRRDRALAFLSICVAQSWSSVDNGGRQRAL